MFHMGTGCILYNKKLGVDGILKQQIRKLATQNLIYTCKNCWIMQVEFWILVPCQIEARPILWRISLQNKDFHKFGNLDVSLDFVSGNIEIRGKQILCFPRDQSLRDLLYSFLRRGKKTV